MLSQLPFIITPLTVLGALAFFAIAYPLYRFVIGPCLLLLHYKRYGGALLFYKELTSFEDCMRTAVSHGDFYLTYRKAIKGKRFIAENFGSQVQLIPTDTEMLKEVFRKTDIYYKDLAWLSVFAELTKSSHLMSNGPEWKRKRIIVANSFNFEFLKGVVPLIAEAAQEKFRDWIDGNELNGKNIADGISTIIGEVTVRYFFGKRLSREQLDGLPIATKMQHLLNTIVFEIYSPAILMFGLGIFRLGIFPRHREMKKDIDMMKDCIGKIIKEIENNPIKENNLLVKLLEYKNKETKEECLTNEEIMDEFMAIFATGTETPTYLLTSSIYFLWKHPDIREKVKEEVDRVIPDLNKLEIEQTNRLEYTMAFLKEVLRLGGPASAIVSRVAVQDDDLCGVKVKKGTLINTALDLMFTSDKYFTDPNKFVPERWLEKDSPYINDAFKKESYAFIPFGAGPRNCLGQHLAMIEAKVILAAFIKTFKWDIPKDYKFILVQRNSWQILHPLLANLEFIKKPE